MVKFLTSVFAGLMSLSAFTFNPQALLVEWRDSKPSQLQSKETLL